MLRYKDLQELSVQLGIHKIGVTAINKLDTDPLNNWLNKGYQGQMSYMERNQDKRLDPSLLLPDAASIISIFVNYHQEEGYPGLDGKISKYARGLDYHLVLKDMLHKLSAQIFVEQLKGLSRKEVARVYRVFVDSAPVMEKYWAVAAGIGWQGKHSNIITQEFGSWGFLGEIITTQRFDQYSVMIPDYCGECTACIDACPTKAIVEPYVVDGSQCISYATIELAGKQSIPSEIRVNMEDWIFGCDVCQDVCPWNRFAKPSQVKDFIPVEVLKNGEVPDFQRMGTSEFDTHFQSTPLERPGLIGMKRNQAIMD